MTRRLLLAFVLLSGLASSVSAQTGYIAFGDSITFGVGDDPLRAEKGYPPRLQSLLQAAGINAVVENFGEPGEDTQMAMIRIDKVLRENALSGDVLLLMEGTNDVSRDVTVEMIRFNLNELAKRAVERGMSVIHATTIPRLPNAKHDPQNVTNTQLNQNIRDMADFRERKLADPCEVFGATPNLFGSFYYTGSDDPVGHPNAAGYDLLAQVFFDVIRGVDRVPPVSGITSPKPGAKDVSGSAPVSVDVLDFGQGIDLAATTLVINGVATGIVWPDGSAAMRWRADDRDAPRSTSVWFSVTDLLRVHGHDGDSEIVYLDPADGEEACCPHCHHPSA